ncbi:transposase family protein [Proteiniphilum sp.]|uniref:transposase family protein n=1 Tax=Proteiniphilum sp. TaxID=1926877 RepID=UPI002B209AF5|nr:transposase family protein [Proteiniphilum sp.]MEA4916314.1 transposase family protein [Proteiniphilum sp.]
MNITSGEIITYNSGLWLSQSYVQGNTDVDFSYLRVAKSRAKRRNGSWKHNEINGICYFDYNSLPDKYRSQLPDIATLQRYAVKPQSDTEDIINEAVWNTYKQFLPDYANYKYKIAKELAQAAAVIHEARNYVELKGISYSKSAVFDQLVKEIRLQELKYLPVTWRNLRDKIQAYASGERITDIIGVKNTGNTNRAKYKNNDFINGTLVELASSQKNYTSAYIYRKIRLICQQNGFEEFPSERWVSDAVKTPEMKFLIQQRYGANTRHNAHYRGYTPMQSALFAGDAWQVDGTRVNIVDHRATWIDKEGKKRTGQKFLYIVAVRDVMSGLPLGWEYCYEESAQAVIGALAMAVRNSGYLPYEFIYDRFPGHNSEEWQWIESQMHLKGVIMTKAHKAEGKGNIERWFGTLQSVFMSESDLYYGEGVKSSRRYAHRSKEYITEMRAWAAKNNFNFDSAIRETDTILENYINTPYNAYSRKFRNIDKSPLELHDESDKPNTIAVDQPQYCFLFGLRKQVSIRNYMIQTQIEGAVYYYGIDDVDITEKYTGEKLWNCFDYEDLSTVHLYHGDTYLGSFNEITPAQRFGPNKDMRAVGITKKIAEKNEERRKQRLQDIERRRLTVTESDEEDAISPEVGAMQGGNIAKSLYEAAETAFLNKEWATDEEEPVHVNSRNMY